MKYAENGNDPLPSWNDGPAKQAIVNFVTRVTTPGGEDFVAEAERVAVFDNDGTLWPEQPLYVQYVFAFDRVAALLPEHPEWEEQEKFRAVLSKDLGRLATLTQRDILDVAAASHGGTTTEEFKQIVGDWLASARHPRFDRPYTECVYQPMLELLAYLRGQGFKTYIVSGGGIEFLRVWAEDIYGVPPEQVVGSSIVTAFEMREGEPLLLRRPEIDFVDDKAGKPVAINKFIGRRPVAAFGNSDGDYEMLRWVTAGEGPRFGLIVHHTDGEREFAYDRESLAGRLDRALDEADERGWTVVDMKRDWKRVFPFEEE